MPLIWLPVRVGHVTIDGQDRFRYEARVPIVGQRHLARTVAFAYRCRLRPSVLRRGRSRIRVVRVGFPATRILVVTVRDFGRRRRSRNRNPRRLAHAASLATTQGFYDSGGKIAERAVRACRSWHAHRLQNPQQFGERPFRRRKPYSVISATNSSKFGRYTSLRGPCEPPLQPLNTPQGESEQKADPERDHTTQSHFAYQQFIRAADD